VTEQQREQEQNPVFRNAFQDSREAMWVLDRERVFYSNPAAAELFGYEAEKPPESLFIADFAPEYQPNGLLSQTVWESQLEEAYQKGEARFDFRYQTRDGRTGEAEVLLSTIDEAGHDYLLASFRDITEQKENAFRLQVEREQLKTIIETIPFGVMLTESDTGHIVMVNQEGLQIARASQEDLQQGGSIIDFYQYPQDREKLRQWLEEEGEVRQAVVGMKRIDGEAYDAQIDIRPVSYQGRPHLLTLFQDLSQDR
jgi:PAS domain S-box-containing protein